MPKKNKNSNISVPTGPQSIPRQGPQYVPQGPQSTPEQTPDTPVTPISAFDFAKEWRDPVVEETPTEQLSVGSGEATSEFVRTSGTLQDMLTQLSSTPGTDDQQDGKIDVDTYSDSYTQALDRQAKTSDVATQSLIAGMKAKNQQQRVDLEGDFDSYKRGLQLLGIQQNSAQSTPDILMSGMKKIQDEYTKKISSLDAEENIALMEAEEARANKDLSTLREKMKYIDKIKADKRDALKDAYSRMNLEGDVAENQVGIYYDSLEKLDEADKEDFLIQLSEKFNVPLPTLIKAMTDERKARVKTGGGGSTPTKNYSASNIPDNILAEIQEELKYVEGVTLSELYSAYPEVSTSYLKSLFDQLGGNVESSETTTDPDRGGDDDAGAGTFVKNLTKKQIRKIGNHLKIDKSERAIYKYVQDNSSVGKYEDFVNDLLTQI